MSRVHYSRKTKPSALALAEALSEAGYNGLDINYGFGYGSEALNKPGAIQNTCNKHRALQTMITAGVPTPRLFVHRQPTLDHQRIAGGSDMYELAITSSNEGLCYNNAYPEYPLVGRPDKHSKGRGFWLCRNVDDVHRALRGTRLKAPATHFLQYIEGAREFRIHVVRDGREGYTNKYRTIKISEKIGEIGATHPNRNYTNGTVFNYPAISDRTRASLRKAARQAVNALGLDFGAVDVLLKDNKVYVLEVNTAPRLTDETSDTLSKYVDAFMRYWSD